MNIVHQIKTYLEELLPDVFTQLLDMGYDRVESEEKSFPTLGVIYIFNILSSKSDRKIEISLHSTLGGPNGSLFFRIKRMPKEEKGYIYNDLHILADVVKLKIYANSTVSRLEFVGYLKEAEANLLGKYSDTLKGKSFKPDKVNFRNM